MRLFVAQDLRDGEDDLLGEPQHQEGQLRNGRRATGGVVPAACLQSEEVSKARSTSSGAIGARDGIRYVMDIPPGSIPLARGSIRP